MASSVSSYRSNPAGLLDRYNHVGWLGRVQAGLRRSEQMDEFLIPNVNGAGGLLFYDHWPKDRSEPINSFSIRVTADNLSAALEVYVGDYYDPHPASLFADMARQ